MLWQRRGAILTAAAALVFAAGVLPGYAKTPGTVHCYGGLCHRINSVDEMDAMVGRRGLLKASYYDDCKRDRFNPCGLTSSGAIFRADLPDNAASPIFPDGTILLTYNPATRLAAVVRVNSTGPYRSDRTLDVSRATAEHLGFARQGVAQLEVAILKSPEDHEARYKKLRSYDPVPGFLGTFGSFESAQDAALSRLQLQAANVSAAAAVATGETGTPAVLRLGLEQLWPRGLAMEVAEAQTEPQVLVDVAPSSDSLQIALADAGPQATVRGSDADASDAGAAVIWPASQQTSAPGATFSAWLWNFIEAARERAKLRRDTDSEALMSDAVGGGGVSGG